MKEKRYYCDWILSEISKKQDRLLNKVLVVSFIIVTVVSSVIFYNILMYSNSEDLEAYSASYYEYLNEIADNVISEDGINVSAIPKDIVEYEITYKDSEITFKYSLDNNKESASMTITLSENFEILSKEPNFFSKEEYVRTVFYFIVPLVGCCTWCILVLIICLVMKIAIPISIIHKKMDIKKLS